MNPITLTARLTASIADKVLTAVCPSPTVTAAHRGDFAAADALADLEAATEVFEPRTDRVPADLDPAGAFPGAVSAGLPAAAPAPGYLFWPPDVDPQYVSAKMPDGSLRTEEWSGGWESDGPDLLQGACPVATARSDFRGCTCDSSQAADLDDHQPRCGAHAWSRTYRIARELLAAADAFPTCDLLDAMSSRLADAIHLESHRH